MIWLEYELFCVLCGTSLENVLVFIFQKKKNNQSFVSLKNDLKSIIIIICQVPKYMDFVVSEVSSLT